MPKFRGYPLQTKDSVMDFKALAEAALERRNALVETVRAINDDAAKTDAEKREQIERVNVDITALEAEARSYVEQGEREAEVRTLAARAAGLFVPSSVVADAEQSESLSEAFRAIASGERRSIDVIADPSYRAALDGTYGSKTSAATNAGNLVGNTFMTELLAAFRENSSVLQTGARVITTATGEKMEWPFKSGNIVAAAVAEGAVYGRSNATFTRVELNAFKYGVIAEASSEMLNDSALPLGSILAEDIGEGIADLTGAKLVSGNGTTEPQGVVTGTTLNSALANKAAITTDALITHQHKIGPKYRRNAKWLVSDAFVLDVRLLKDGNGRYVWQDGIVAGGPGGVLLGAEVVIDPNVQGTVGAGYVPAVYGDFSKYLVRMVGGVNVSRSDEYGWDADVVAWKGNVRLDAGVVDAGAFAKIVLSA